MNIIVTGGAGFIGSHLCEALLRRGDQVTVIDDFNDFYSPTLKRTNILSVLDNPSFTLAEVDIRDRASLLSVLEAAKPDVICHLAARAGVRPSIEDPILYEEVNCRGTMNILESVNSLGLKLTNFVFASSSSVYGTNSKTPFSETDPLNSLISPYAVTKRSSELMLHAYHHLYGIPVTCLRFFTVYGERGRPDLAIAKFTKLIHEGREISVYGDGSAKRDFTYIGDIIGGVLAAIDKPLGYEVINLGESRTIDVNEMIALIEGNLGKKAKINYGPPVPGDVPLTYADITKAKKLIGYDPITAIEDGIERYVKWYLSVGKDLS